MERPLKTILLSLNEESFAESGQYTSPVIDSGERDCTWHRLTLTYSAPPGSILEISLYASNYRYAEFKEAFFDTFINPGDILLHRARGRYLWFRIKRSGDFNIERLSVSYPAQSPLRYLPEIYQAEPTDISFADHFLSIFQSLYDDLELEIDRSSLFLDAKSCPREFLPWLASFLAIDEPQVWRGEALREVIAQMPELYRTRGTIQGMKRLFSLCCRAEYFFLEGFHAIRYEGAAQWSVLSRLLPKNRFSFLVLVCGDVSESRERTLRHLLETNKPAHTSAQLRLLKRRVILDNDSFLGINTELIKIKKACLDGRSPLNYTVTGG